MSKVTTLTLSDETYARLRALADQSGDTTSDYIHRAIEAHLDDVEDAREGERALDRLRRGEDEVMEPDDFWRDVAD